MGNAALQLEEDDGAVASGRWLRLVTLAISGAALVPELKGNERFTVPTPDPKTARGLSGYVSCLDLSSPFHCGRGKAEAAATAGRLEVR